MDYDPVPDPHEDNPPRRRKAPEALKQLMRQYPYERRLAIFKEVFGRDPSPDSDELETFFDEYIREIYNNL
jgi:hypothetical protein